MRFRDLDDRRHLKIEMILPSLAAAGMETMTARLSRRLAGAGHDVGVTCLAEAGALAPALVEDGHRVTVVPTPGVRTNFRPTALTAWLRERRPDVVHVHTGAWLKGAHAARLAGVSRVVHTEHGLLDRDVWYGAALKRWAAYYTDQVVAVSAPLRDHLARTTRIPARAIRVILNGVDTAAFRPGRATGALRERLGIGAEGPIIGHVARLAPVKNQAMLVDAFARLRARIPAATLVLVGEGPERPRLEARIAELGLGASVFLLGEARRVEPLYREFDVFVLPSLTEGTSMSILEAMASGICVVASAVGGTPDLLDHGGCGVLLKRNDAETLADALAVVLANPVRRAALASAGRERAASRFSEARMVRDYETAYYGTPRRARARRRPRERARCAG